MPVINLDDLPVRELIPGYTVRFIHTENPTLAYWDIQAGAALPLHHHPHEQVTNLLEGEFELTLDDQPCRLASGQAAVIPANAPHAGVAITNCRILDVFYPARQDYQS
jgi:quercetin dioxygenase-like cupin family protein